MFLDQPKIKLISGLYKDHSYNIALTSNMTVILEDF
jgi:hypothetical protein